MANLLFVPCLNTPYLAARALASLGRPPGVDVVFVDSSPAGLSEIPIMETIRLPGTTFSAVQNAMQREAFSRGAEWLLFMHADAHCLDSRVVPDLLAWACAIGSLGIGLTQYDSLCAYRVTALQEIGPWDEQFTWHWSDVDYYRRAVLAGWEVAYWPDRQRVEHSLNGSLKHCPALRASSESESEAGRERYLAKWGDCRSFEELDGV